MTYTKRQWFMYRLEQCINLSRKIDKYLTVVIDYTEGSKYEKKIKRLYSKNMKNFRELIRLKMEFKK